MSWLPDDVREASGGEVIDRAARDAVRLAHRALERFPDIVRRHKVLAGGAAISSSLVVLAGVAVAHRMRSGQSAEEAVNSVTAEEIQGFLPGDEEDGAALEAPADQDSETSSAPAADAPSAPAAGANGLGTQNPAGVTTNGHSPGAGQDAPSGR